MTSRWGPGEPAPCFCGGLNLRPWSPHGGVISRRASADRSKPQGNAKVVGALRACVGGLRASPLEASGGWVTLATARLASGAALGGRLGGGATRPERYAVNAMRLAYELVAWQSSTTRRRAGRCGQLRGSRQRGTSRR